jgi:hypothetical protein
MQHFIHDDSTCYKEIYDESSNEIGIPIAKETKNIRVYFN